MDHSLLICGQVRTAYLEYTEMTGRAARRKSFLMGVGSGDSVFRGCAVKGR